METLYTEARARLLSCTSQTNASDARQILKAELAEAKNFVRFIQDTHNALSPALQIPNEIWIEIGWIVFKSCKETWLPEENFKNGLLEGFLPLTHISRHLRSLLHSTPSFWTRLDLGSPAADLILELSGDLGIHATCHEEQFRGMRPTWGVDEEDRRIYFEDDIFLKASEPTVAVAAKERIESVLIVSDCEGISECMKNWDNCRFPRLLHLTLQLIEYSEVSGDWTDPDVRLLNVPLSTLRLHGVQPKFHSSCYSALRHLTLSSYPNRPSMGMLSLVRLLAQCKLLEELCLLNIITTLPSSSQSSRFRVSLNNLRSLTIGNKKEIIRFIVELVEAPMLQHLYLHVEPYSTPTRLFEDLVPASHPLQDSMKQTKGLTIRYSRGIVTISALQDPLDSQNYTPAENSDFSFKIEFTKPSFEEHPDSLETLISFICAGYTNYVCESLIVELQLHRFERLENTMETWSILLFPALPNLRKLSVSFQGGGESLEHTITALTPQVTQVVLCPSLSDIRLSAHYRVADISSGLNCSELSVLKDMVKSRYSAHAPLTSLRFNTNVLWDHPLFEALMKYLNEVIQHVKAIHHQGADSDIPGSDSESEIEFV